MQPPLAFAPIAPPPLAQAPPLRCALPPPMPAMALPIFTIANLDDLEAMIVVAKPREIDIAALPAVRDAPEFLAVVEEKVALGWTCPRIPS